MKPLELISKTLTPFDFAQDRPCVPLSLAKGFAPNVILRPPEAAEESGGVWSTDTSTPLQTLRFAQGDRRWAISSARLLPRERGIKGIWGFPPYPRPFDGLRAGAGGFPLWTPPAGVL